ncbi:hypothetical protein MMC07_007599 [Pseudocyphellaria aurata]|nr:hypothetical protein [Pseudocyphellaria aurata]
MDGHAEGPSTLPYGRKRRANDHLESDQRLAKRFNLLNLNQIGKHHLPVKEDGPQRPAHVDNGAESMQLDDTKEKVYIYNLDQELSDVESEEEKLVFLPDIERKLGKIPQSVLTSQSQPVTSSEMILYQVPSSLSIPRENDKVRTAIIESRARARVKQIEDAKDLSSQNRSAQDMAIGVESDEHYGGHIDWNEMNDDQNAMDIG